MSSNFLGFGDREKRMCVSGIIHITTIIWLIFEKYQKGMEMFMKYLLHMSKPCFRRYRGVLNMKGMHLKAHSRV